MTLLRDRDGEELRNGFYLAAGEVYKIEITGSTFSARSWDGFTPIQDYKLFAKQLTRINNPEDNARFVLSMLER